MTHLSWNDAVIVGLIELSTSLAISAEAPDGLPDGVRPLLTRIRLPRGEVSAAALDEMVASDRLEEAARELADGGASVISFACTTGSLVRGPGFDRELVRRIEHATGVRASTTSTALVAALEALGARTVAVATPYVDALNALERRFLEAHGFEVAALRGLGIGTDPEITRVPYARTRDLVREAVAEAGEPDVVFISCTGLPTLALLDELERELRRPVISSNAVTLWHAMRLAGVEPSAAGVGSLLAGGAPPQRRDRPRAPGRPGRDRHRRRAGHRPRHRRDARARRGRGDDRRPRARRGDGRRGGGRGRPGGRRADGRRLPRGRRRARRAGARRVRAARRGGQQRRHRRAARRRMGALRRGVAPDDGRQPRRRVLHGRAAARHMLGAGGGAIVNIASHAAWMPGVGVSPAYPASKAGVLGLTMSFAAQLADRGVRVNAVAPALVASRDFGWSEAEEARRLAEYPLGAGRPEDVGEAVRYLASPAARWVTGTVLYVHGGHRRSGPWV